MTRVIKELGGKPFLTDCNTLYVGGRKNALEHIESAYQNGFTPYTTGCHILIADGLKGNDEVAVPVQGGDYIKEAKIGRALMDAVGTGDAPGAGDASGGAANAEDADADTGDADADADDAADADADAADAAAAANTTPARRPVKGKRGRVAKSSVLQGETKAEHPFVRAARQTAANATRPR